MTYEGEKSGRVKRHHWERWSEEHYLATRGDGVRKISVATRRHGWRRVVSPLGDMATRNRGCAVATRRHDRRRVMSPLCETSEGARCRHQARRAEEHGLTIKRFPSIETTKPASSYPPLGELDRPIQLAQWRVKSTMSNLGSALSSHSPELSPTSPDETVSCLISIGVTVETLR
ncbi:hypothetical protein DY000_02031374 [Brassica cretica]|uniref:DUF4005 domain-containing protein n=1 Tax=Brassica cretica TaxID=69181 RepID=A0ABQ7DY60_BRACR|nr:hypothetical protein DY000_02031374 [Brassica cretica]